MKKTASTNRNIRVFAVNDGNKPGFEILLDFSGQKEYLVHHRNSGLLYLLLKDGMRLDDLRRYEPVWSHEQSRYIRDRHNKKGTQLEAMVAHLLLVIDGYLMERESAAVAMQTRIGKHISDSPLAVQDYLVKTA